MRGAGNSYCKLSNGLNWEGPGIVGKGQSKDIGAQVATGIYRNLRADQGVLFPNVTKLYFGLISI